MDISVTVGCADQSFLDLDFLSHPVPAGAGLDVGAFESQGKQPFDEMMIMGKEGKQC